MAEPTLCLASASPRRRELLTQIGVRFSVLPVDIDESPRPGETARDFVVRMAVEKARAGAAHQASAGLPVLGADTDVIIDGEILGKPADKDDGQSMLLRLSGRSHQVLSAVALAGKDLCEWRLSESKVGFRQLDEEEIHNYWQTGEPAGKAGGYAIQGIGAVFIERLEGSYSGVMGLPLLETAQLLRQVGIKIPSDGQNI